MDEKNCWAHEELLMVVEVMELTHLLVLTIEHKAECRRKKKENLPKKKNH